MSLVRIKIKRDTAANYTASNIVLLLGEFAYETDTFTLSGGVRYYKFKIGDGTTAWNDLPYARLSAVGGGGGATQFIELTDVPGAYTGAAGRYVKVNETADGLEFEVIEAADLPSGIDAAKLADGSISNTEFQYLNGLSGNIQSQLDGKQASGNYFNKSADDTDDITEGTNKFATAAEKAKLANIIITQAVDLDAIESRVNELDAAVVLKGSWDASAGTFPGAGVAQAGWSYVVSVSGTVDGVQFVAGDRIIALTDNASTTVYANNWLKADYSDLVTSLDGTTGALTLGSIIANLTGKTTPVDADTFALSDSESSNASKKFTWANLKAAIKSYYDAVTATLTNKSINLANNTLSGTLAQFNSAISDDNIIPESGGTFTGDILVPDEAYDATNWNNNIEVPTKNAIRDKIESMGSGLTNWNEAFSSSVQNNSSFTPNNAASDVTAVVRPKGTGAFCLAIPDGTSTGGNARGAGAIDLQLSRSSALDVANGQNSWAIGANNRSTGTFSGAAGVGNVSSGTYSGALGAANLSTAQSAWCIGESNSATSNYACAGPGYLNEATANYTFAHGRQGQAYLYGFRAHAIGAYSNTGDCQLMEGTMFISITGTGQTEVLIGGGLQAILKTGNTIWGAFVSVMATVKTVGNGTFVQGDSVWDYYAMPIKRLGSTTSTFGTGPFSMFATRPEDANMSTSVITIDADDSTEALRVRFTPPSTAGSTSVILVQAKIQNQQITF